MLDERRGVLELPGELLAPLAALGGLLVEPGRLCRRAAAPRKPAHHHPVLVRAEADTDFVADGHRAGPLHRRIIDLDLPAADRLRRQRARLEETRGPEPLVEADALVLGVGGFVTTVPRV